MAKGVCIPFLYILLHCDTNNALCNDKASQHNISVGFWNLVTVFCLDNQTLWGKTAQICRCSLKRKKLHPSWRHQETPPDIRSVAWFVSLWLAAVARCFPPCGLLSEHASVAATGCSVLLHPGSRPTVFACLGALVWPPPRWVGGWREIWIGRIDLSPCCLFVNCCVWFSGFMCLESEEACVGFEFGWVICIFIFNR